MAGAVGDRIKSLIDGGFTCGTQVLKTLSLGAKAVGVRSHYLFSLTTAGQPCVERALSLMRNELMRDALIHDMELMGGRSISDLSPSNLRVRQNLKRD